MWLAGSLILSLGLTPSRLGSRMKNRRHDGRRAYDGEKGDAMKGKDAMKDTGAMKDKGAMKDQGGQHGKASGRNKFLVLGASTAKRQGSHGSREMSMKGDPYET